MICVCEIMIHTPCDCNCELTSLYENCNGNFVYYGQVLKSTIWMTLRLLSTCNSQPANPAVALPLWPQRGPCEEIYTSCSSITLTLAPSQAFEQATLTPDYYVWHNSIYINAQQMTFAPDRFSVRYQDHFPRRLILLTGWTGLNWICSLWYWDRT